MRHFLSRSKWTFVWTLGLLASCASYEKVPAESMQTQVAPQAIVHRLPELGYPYQALEPYVDARTMEIHYDKHHRSYVDNLNKALVGTPFASQPLEVVLAAPQLPAAIRNNGGGHYNHSLFWSIMAPPSKGGGRLMPGSLQAALIKKFGSVDKFKEVFTNAALTRFGSGWAWLVVTKDGSLEVTSSEAQDNPLMPIEGVIQGTPILGLDVWEHAYYLKYQNRRPDYVKAWWNVVNWPEVQRLYESIQAAK